MFNSSKIGFEAPIANLLRTSLREWAENLISQKNLKNIEYLNTDIVRRKWEEH